MREVLLYICNTVIAICALFVSIVATYYQIMMNRRSVQPYLSFDLVDLNHRIAVNIVNDGVGIALIRKFSITYKGKKSETDNLYNEVINRCHEKGLEINSSVWKRYDNPKAIGPSQKKVILEAENVDTKQLIELKKILADIEINVEYTSIYWQKSEASCELEYFGRNIKTF